MNVAEYVRAIEHHVCQKNDGHLIRVVGPAFEAVSRWERDGVPLKVAIRGIDRYFERYYRHGPRRRPVRVEFCEADVLDVFDEWRRAVGPLDAGPSAEDPATAGAGRERTGTSLPVHLERVMIKLSSARALGRLGAGADEVIDRIASELELARTHARGLRGDARRALIARLVAIDAELLAVAASALTDVERHEVAAEADAELGPFRERMPADGYARAHRTLCDRLVRERTALPVVSFS